MERADIHLIDIRDDASIRQFIRDSRNQFLCRLLRESGNKNAFRLYAAFLYEINRSLNKRIGLTCSRSRSNEDGTFGSSYRFSLSLVCISKIKHLSVLHPFLWLFLKCGTSVWHNFHDINNITLKCSTSLRENRSAYV